MYGHIKQLAEAEKKGIEAAGGHADVYQSVLNTPLPGLPQQLIFVCLQSGPFC